MSFTSVAEETRNHPVYKKYLKSMSVRRDTIDFRDRVYIPSLTEVPRELPLEKYKKLGIPVLNQGDIGACTGFALATVIHFLLLNRDRMRETFDDPEIEAVSPRMLFEMAKRYDEWQGEDYDWSSPRAAMKGWHKHGVCSHDLWPFPGETATKDDASSTQLTEERSLEALQRPLGAYFRVNQADLVSMHCALAEVGILYASARVHWGWYEPEAGTGRILRQAWRPGDGGHAFAIVGYDREGFYIQNSWDTSWGSGGFGKLSYDDWLENGMDVWVARLGAPMDVSPLDIKRKIQGDAATGLSPVLLNRLRGHYIAVDHDGQLKMKGNIRTEALDIDGLAKRVHEAKSKAVAVHAHGGLVEDEDAIKVLAGYYEGFRQADVYPLELIWNTDLPSTLSELFWDGLRKFARQLAAILAGRESVSARGLDAKPQYDDERFDEFWETALRSVGGPKVWAQMKNKAKLACQQRTGNGNGAAYLLAQHLIRMNSDKGIKINLVGHSAGSILHGYLLSQLRRQVGSQRGFIKNCILWAPACTMDFFSKYYLPALKSNFIEKLSIFALTDSAERDDNCYVYRKSLLYLVSNAFEEKPRIWNSPDGVPLLGMQKFLEREHEINKDFNALLKAGKLEVVYAPNVSGALSSNGNGNEFGARSASNAKHHGDFDNDRFTVAAALTRMLGQESHSVDLSLPDANWLGKLLNSEMLSRIIDTLI